MTTEFTKVAKRTAAKLVGFLPKRVLALAAVSMTAERINLRERVAELTAQVEDQLKFLGAATVEGSRLVGEVHKLTEDARRAWAERDRWMAAAQKQDERLIRLHAEMLKQHTALIEVLGLNTYSLDGTFDQLLGAVRDLVEDRDKARKRADHWESEGFKPETRARLAERLLATVLPYVPCPLPKDDNGSLLKAARAEYERHVQPLTALAASVEEVPWVREGAC